METARIEELIYQTLIAEPELINKLGGGEESVYHIQAPAVVKYPSIVYNVLSSVPNLHADNEVVEYSAKVRIHIITEDSEYAEVSEEVEKVMRRLRGARYDRNTYTDKKEETLILDYRVRVNAKELPTIEEISGDSGDCKCECKVKKIVTEEEIDKFFEEMESEYK